MEGQENIHVTTFNGIKVYHCTAGKSDDQWRKEFKGKERQLKKNEEFQSRLTLIHDFSFPGCATRVKVSPDGRYIAAAGTYKPRLKLFECQNMSMKVERFSDEEITQIQFLADDYSKIACSRNDRTVELHSQAGLYTTIKTPRHIRDLSYHAPTCDLFIASNADELYRYNLEQGSFQSSIFSTHFNEDNGGINCIGQNQIFPLLSLCGRNGVESFDLRDRTSCGFLDIINTLNDAQEANKILNTSMFSNINNNNGGFNNIASNNSISSLLRSISDSKSPLEATSIRYNDENGLEVAVGLSTGHVLLYDLRSSKPLMILDHRYDLPIHSIKYHTASRTLITADKKTCRLWDYTTPNLTPQQRHLTTINAPAPMNDLTIVDETGMIFMACDSPQMHIYFVPRLGTVPDWAAALESLTEELDHQSQVLLQKQYKILATGVDTTSNLSSTGMNMAHIGSGHDDMSNSVFDDSKFITRDELEQWGMTHLITQKNMLTPYMHGFLIKLELYEQLKEIMMIEGKISDGFDDHLTKNKSKMQTELEFVEETIRKEMDKSRDSGFKLDSTMPTVNKDLAALLLNQDALGDNKKEKEKKSRSKLAKEAEHADKVTSILEDDRFKVLFQDEDYDVDYQSEEYRRLNPQLKKSALLTTEALKRVADPTKSTSLRAPTFGLDDGSNNNADMDLLRMESVDTNMKNMSSGLGGAMGAIKNYEAKGLLDAVGFASTGNASLEAKGQLTSKQIKEREKAEKLEKSRQDTRQNERDEALRIAQLDKHQKQTKLNAFLTASNTIVGKTALKKTSTNGGVSLSGVKTGVGMSDLLSGHGTTNNSINKNNQSTSKQINTGVAPVKRFMSLADQVRMEEEEKAFRERAYIQQQLMQKRDDERNAAQSKQDARDKRRSAAQPKTNGKIKQRNVY